MSDPSSFAHPDLTEARMRTIVGVVGKVRRELVDAWQPERGEQKRSLGIRFLERLSFELFQEQMKNPWLQLTDPSLHLRFQVGAVVIGIYRGSSKRPKGRTVLCRHPELTQTRLAFPNQPAEGSCVRLAFEPDQTERVGKVFLVRMTLGGSVIEDWDLTDFVCSELQNTREAPPADLPIPPPTPMVRPGKEIDPPKAKRRRKKDDEGEGSGVAGA